MTEGMYRIVYYRTTRGASPIEEFLDGLPEKHQRKVAGFLELLAELGPRLARPYADHVRGALRELRIQFARNEYRVFHFFIVGERVVLVHAFSKKTQELPVREIETAEERMKDFQRRVDRGEVVP
ncbi:MAG: type II toxin-antitoxin system RelE/ParE family toxin [Planctomycetes bacterium]|nr:type II toxin-antitoxin system RelE/ParE family toxin [Planctomycetota bacterium]